jgi:hypothetical protein
MMTAKNLFELAQLAEASYASIDSFSDLEAAVQNQNENAGARMEIFNYINLLRADQGVLDPALAANESRIRKAT